MKQHEARVLKRSWQTALLIVVSGSTGCYSFGPKDTPHHTSLPYDRAALYDLSVERDNAILSASYLLSGDGLLRASESGLFSLMPEHDALFYVCIPKWIFELYDILESDLSARDMAETIFCLFWSGNKGMHKNMWLFYDKENSIFIMAGDSRIVERCYLEYNGIMQRTAGGPPRDSPVEHEIK
ncbi:MAG: hypothetical protein U1E27_08045 [Kiritimatiellia bacterium]|nr:hypothetical protein [Kiritimatiellia bacterium]